MINLKKKEKFFYDSQIRLFLNYLRRGHMMCGGWVCNMRHGGKQCF